MMGRRDYWGRHRCALQMYMLPRCGVLGRDVALFPLPHVSMLWEGDKRKDMGEHRGEQDGASKCMR